MRVDLRRYRIDKVCGSVARPALQHPSLIIDVAADGGRTGRLVATNSYIAAVVPVAEVEAGDRPGLLPIEAVHHARRLQRGRRSYALLAARASSVLVGPLREVRYSRTARGLFGQRRGVLPQPPNIEEISEAQWAGVQPLATVGFSADQLHLLAQALGATGSTAVRMTIYPNNEATGRPRALKVEPVDGSGAYGILMPYVLR